MGWLGLDGNPLRRTVDRLHTAVKLALLTVFLATGPLIAAGVAHHLDTAGVHAQHRQAPRRAVTAILLADTPRPPGHTILTLARPLVEAQWTPPDGTPRTGGIRASWNQRVGDTARIWIDDAGRPTSGPIRHSEIISQGRVAAILTLAACALALFVIHLLIRRIFDRRRMVGWEANWSAVEPWWTGRRDHR